ncbi:hypothetical protein CFT13S00388_02610 [Campylobacter fetus subsp. testudinum]|uniref:hypothetical protein n=1 Tax=Campylobacter fetus TaxID=196 RepID=UPI00081875B4|nr:hypothetical protein [Campylobacter fetus]OCR88076.1 hypothetical protein CFT13S00388_02610 [Campylobacter fetus subsp. testudinum]
MNDSQIYILSSFLIMMILLQYQIFCINKRITSLQDWLSSLSELTTAISKFTRKILNAISKQTKDN